MPWLAAVIAGLAVLALDQAAKHFVLARSRYAAAIPPRGLLALCCVINRRDAAYPGIGFILCIAAAVIALTQAPLNHSPPSGIGIGLAIGGITSNFSDLTRRGGIVDFLAIGHLPVCNIADFAILGGLALVALTLVQGM